MVESNKVHCKICKELKIRIESGKYPDSRNKRYVDENGKHWSGKTCADCQRTRTKENMRSLRFKKELEEKEADEEKIST